MFLRDSLDGSAGGHSLEAYIGMVLLAGFSFPPMDWALCDGSLLPISEYEALFSLIGTTYGGDGMSNFALPDLRGRVPVGVGQLAQGQNYVIGQKGGVEQVTLTLSTYPSHSHALVATMAAGNTGVPTGAFPASGQNIYSSSTNLNLTLNPLSISASAGGSQPHPNLQPYLAMNWIICVNGIYPPRS